MSNNPRPPLFIISLCRGSRLSSRPRSWRSWEAFIRRFLANLESSQLIVFHSESAYICVSECPPPGNWCFVHLCFALPSRSRPSPTVSSTLLTSLALDYLIVAQMRAMRTVFSCFPTRLKHPNPTPKPEFCLYLILHSNLLFCWNSPILLNKSEKWNWVFVLPAPTQRRHVSRDARYPNP